MAKKLKVIESNIQPNPKEAEIWVTPTNEDGSKEVKYWNRKKHEWVEGGSGSGSGSGKKLDCLAVLSIITKDNEIVKINLNSKEILYNDIPLDVVLKKIDYEHEGADNVYMITIGELRSTDLNEIVCTSFGWVDDYSGIFSPGLILGDTYVTPSESASSVGGETKIWKSPRYHYFVWYDGYADAEKYNILYILNDPTNIPT